MLFGAGGGEFRETLRVGRRRVPDGAVGGDPSAARPKKGELRPWGRSRTESLGGLKDEQPEVGPKGAASGAMQVKDCRKAAPRGELGWENQ